MDTLQHVAPPPQYADDDQFLAVIESGASLPRHVRPQTAAIVTMCTLARCLTPGQSHRLLEALPTSIRPIFVRCMDRDGQLVEKLDDAEFLDRMAHRLELTPAHAELVAYAVFNAVRARIPSEVIRNVATQLHKSLVGLWLGDRRPAFDVAQAEGGAGLALLEEIYDAVPLPIGITPTDALSSVLCGLGARLSGGESRDLLLALPEELRPLVERCLVRRTERAAVFGGDELVARVADDLATTPLLAKAIIGAVFVAVKHQLPAKEIDDVASQLPPDLRETWISA
jgi:uncharacterized protein (DUF2267 family)